MFPRDIPDGPWQDLATDFFTFDHKEYLHINNTLNKYPFIFKIASKTAEAIQLKH